MHVFKWVSVNCFRTIYIVQKQKWLTENISKNTLQKLSHIENTLLTYQIVATINSGRNNSETAVIGDIQLPPYFGNTIIS